MKKLATIALLMLLAGGSGAQETLYVTERLFLGLYEEPDNGGERLMLIPSGEAVTVLERQANDARVRAADGSEGWVRLNALTADLPARARVTQLEARIAELETAAARIPRLEAAAARIPRLEAAAARVSELETAAARVPELEAALAAAREEAAAEPPPLEPDPETLAALDAAEQRIAELAVELAEARVAVEQAGGDELRKLWPWLAAWFVVVLLLGFGGGWFLLDYRVRQQHGGFRTW